MKSMREMINLTEGVVAVPGLNEKSTSEKQARFMAAAAHDPKFAKKVGISQDVAKEFNQADKGTKQLSNAMKHVNEKTEELSTWQKDSILDIYCYFCSKTSFRDKAKQDTIDRLFSGGVISSPQRPAAEALIDDFESDGASGDGVSEAQVDTCRQSNPKAAKDACAMEEEAVEEAYDLNNGYDDIETADGTDYFPNGADGPVVKSTGPSGARQGDNSEQKKMQVDETHRELVYAYRNFLKESNTQKKN